MRRIVLGLLSLFSLVTLGTAQARADAAYDPQAEQAPLPSPERAPEFNPRADPRLPPVLPGEEVSVGGKRMRLWSTSGPVPVSPAAQAPAAAQVPGEGLAPNVDLGGLGVIVDQRPRTDPR
jgi:hypothetical protein